MKLLPVLILLLSASAYAFLSQPSSTGGATLWGGITGTLSSQTDLQSALNAKENSFAILPIAKGGTNTGTAFSAGSLVFSDGTSFTQDNANLTWNDANNYLYVNNKIQIGSVDAFGRSQIWNAMTNASIRLGALGQDGDFGDVNSEGIVVYGANSQGTAINSATGNFGYARIKADRIGLLTAINNVQNYYFRADPTELYMKDDAGTKTFQVVRASGQTKTIGGVQLSTSTAQPACNVGNRGLMWIVQGGAGVADELQICMKNAADAYVWTANN